MMHRLTKPERVAVGIWLVMAALVWNGIYDVLLTRGVKEYLFRWALHEAGRGPAVPIGVVMEMTVRDAIGVSTLWSSILLLAGLVTIRLMRSACTH